MAVELLIGSDAARFVTNTRRPQLRRKSGKSLNTNAGHDFWDQVVEDEDVIVTNSFLDKREWAALDRAIIQAVHLRLNGVQHLRDRGLVRSTTLAEMLSQWRVASERTAANVNMDGRSAVNKDRADKKVYGTPVPIISADYTIGRRELLASRSLGAGLDTTEASEAAQSVAEKGEDILFNGASGIVVGSDSVVGYTTLSARDTDTAANYGGGDFGTISNIVPTFLGMLNALSAKRYHGPFLAYVSDTQYHQMLEYYTDGSGQMALDRVKALPQIADVYPSDFLVSATGEVVLVQATPNVVQLIVGLELMNREWESPDGTELNYKVMMAIAPKLVTDFSGNAGIGHATGA